MKMLTIKLLLITILLSLFNEIASLPFYSEICNTLQLFLAIGREAIFMNKFDIGILATLVSLLGVLAKVVADYTKVKGTISNLNSECKDIRLDVSKDIKSVQESYTSELKTIKEDFKAEKKYTHESFVKITEEQRQASDVLKEVSITLRAMTTSIDQRLMVLEHKIDSITTLKVANDVKC